MTMILIISVATRNLKGWFLHSYTIFKYLNYLVKIFGIIIALLLTNFIGMATKEKKDPCWSGYTQKGTKEKAGKTVPNCVKSSSKKKD